MTRVMALLASTVPVMVGLVLLVIRSPSKPESLLLASPTTGTAGGVASTVKVNTVPLPVIGVVRLPATSIALTMTL